MNNAILTRIMNQPDAHLLLRKVEAKLYEKQERRQIFYKR